MQLNYEIYGEGQPLIILHGLFGTLENWGAQIKSLSQHYQVIAVDLRNHGRSPHSDEVGYAAMAKDIQNLITDLQLSSAHILGHSMGGKVAMQLALNQPELIRKLIVVDIAPVQYQPHHDEVFEGLFSIPLTQIKSRREADTILAEKVAELGVRAFLLKNLYREGEQFAWRMNLEALHSNYQAISAPPEGTPYSAPMLFIKGGNSNYMIPAYRDQVLSLFPQADYKIIKNAGHWPHAEKPAEFTEIVLDYLNS